MRHLFRIWTMIDSTHSPLRTWTLTATGSPREGEQEYVPESEGRACCITRKDDVTSAPLSVITLTPPRAESYEMICKKKKMMTVVRL